jgi:nucleoid-associated protein YgaU
VSAFAQFQFEQDRARQLADQDVAVAQAQAEVRDPGGTKAPKPTTQRTPEAQHVNFYALDGPGDLTVPMGDGPAVLTGGDSGWQVEERWGNSPVTWWLAPTPHRQTIPIMFRGSGDHLESRINELLAMARSPGGRKPPPVVMVAGAAVHRADLEWVIESLEPTDPTRRREGDGNRTRQGYVVNLLQYGAVEVVGGKQATRTKRRARVKSWRVGEGDTLMKIAASSQVYADARRWKEIARANGIRDPRSLVVGRVLRIP